MRSAPVLAGTAFVAFSTLLVAAPAFAGTTLSDVTDVVVVHTTNENFEYGVYTPWEPEGTATFPSVVDAGDGGSYVLQGYQPVMPELAEGCSAEILSFTVDLHSLQAVSGGAESGFFVGLPAVGTDDTTASFEGTGALTPDTTWFEVAPLQGVLDGVLTVTLPEAITVQDVPLAFVGFYTSASATGPLWQIDSVAFQVSTTCPDTPAPAVPALAATGSESLIPLAIGGFALLVMGVLTRLRTRRAD